MARLIAIAAFVSIALTCVVAEDLYSDKYDNTDIRSILENEKLRVQYYNCFMDLGQCAPGAMAFYKKTMPEALTTNCKKCTEVQRRNLDIIAEWYANNNPGQWEALINKSIQNMQSRKNSQ